MMGGKPKLTTEIFINRAKQKHGDKYDYSKVEYVNNHEKVCIICPEHGEFWQTPNNHMKGINCPKCGTALGASKVSSNKSEFINKARMIHGDKYDYSKVEYINNKTKVCIICPKHGEFWQAPTNHLYGYGCVSCGHETAAEKQTSNIDVFVQKAKKVHGDKYDYSKVKYVKKNMPVCIICPEHGEFYMRTDNHLSGQNCPKCARISQIDKASLSLFDFIDKAKCVHKNKYDYSLVNYINNHTKVKIICPEHGVFEQTPMSHLAGNGCAQCSSSKGEKRISDILDAKLINYMREKTIKYRDGSYGRLDFLLIHRCIEYDGEQHFRSNDYFGGIEYLKHITECDNRKNNYCKENQLPLLRIRYDQIDDIEAILNHFLANPDFYKDRYNPYLTNEEYYSIREAT